MVKHIITEKKIIMSILGKIFTTLPILNNDDDNERSSK